MQKIILQCVILSLIFGCTKKADEIKDACTSKTSSSKFKMYSRSEMAVLMEQMYIENLNLKNRIKKGASIGKFPSHFLDIHQAVMTDQSENDAFFKTQAALFIKSQELIYNDPANAKLHFNDGINACVSCHEVKCGGPILKIKKLYIK